MAHTHKFDVVKRFPVSMDAREIGVMEAEKRVCSECGQEGIFLHAGGKWFRLSEETSTDERDILLA